MGLEITSTPPTTVSREEHTSITSSTPQSFGDIPPILRFQDQVEITLSAGESSVNYEGRLKGELWVTEQEVVFIPTSGTGFKLNYQSLTLHALTPASAELEAHLYCQIDDSPADPLGGGDEDEYGEMRELRVFIQDSKLSPLFEALSDCSALHDSILPNGETSSFPFFPPGEDGDDDEEWEEEDDEDGDGDEEMNGTEEGTGRVHSRRHGQIMISLGGDDTTQASRGIKMKTKTRTKDNGDGGDQGEDVDQVERFLGMVDWGNVPKPSEWAEDGEFDDAPEDGGEVEDINALAERLGAVDVNLTKSI